MSLNDEPRRSGNRRGSEARVSKATDAHTSNRTHQTPQRTPTGAAASGKATAVYNALAAELDARRQLICWPMWYVDDRAGSPDGYFSKAMHPDTPGGRQATWFSLQLIFDALYPAGFRIRVEPLDPSEASALAMPETEHVKRVRTHTSEHYRALGRAGGRATIARHGSAHLQHAGRLGGLARARNRRKNGNGQEPTP